MWLTGVYFVVCYRQLAAPIGQNLRLPSMCFFLRFFFVLGLYSRLLDELIKLYEQIYTHHGV